MDRGKVPVGCCKEERFDFTGCEFHILSLQMTRRPFSVLIMLGLLVLPGCHKEDAAPSRTYRMGFQNSAPRFDSNSLVVQVLNIWSQSADAAIISTEVPWDSLLNGQDPKSYIVNNYSGLVSFYRQHNFKLWVFVDPANGLNRASDADALVAVGKSIAQPSIQKIYRRFVVAMDSILHPDHLGLALETNLIRYASPDSIYQGVRTAANAAVADVRALDPTVSMGVSVQADLAWGNLTGTNTFVGVEQDFADFSFLQELGISSYPYFNVARPEDLPVDYYSRLTGGRSVPVFVSEGGWTSQSFTGPSNNTIQGSPQLQQDYVTRQSQLLDQAKAIAWFQLTFTDIDIAHLPPNTNPTIDYFAYLGLVDINLTPKPSLTTWKGIFARPLK
jgi:hypothetical protein